MAPKRPRPPEFFDGDLVRFTGPARLVSRVGYPETWREACERIGPANLLRAIAGIRGLLYGDDTAQIRRPTKEEYKLAREIGHYAASMNGFGGDERTVHYVDWPEPPKLMRVDGPTPRPERSGALAGVLVREGERLPGSPAHDIDDGESTSFHFTRTIRLLSVDEIDVPGGGYPRRVLSTHQVMIDLPDIFGLVVPTGFDRKVAAPDVEIVSRGMAWAWARGGALKKGQPCWILHGDYMWREGIWSDGVNATASRKRPDFGAVEGGA